MGFDMSNSLEQRNEVIVIGAGPTGLMAAYLLHQAGVRVKLLDKNPAAVKESRAAAVVFAVSHVPGRIVG